MDEYVRYLYIMFFVYSEEIEVKYEEDVIIVSDWDDNIVLEDGLWSSYSQHGD